MSIWNAKTYRDGRRLCMRCGKIFLPRKEGQKYGPKCARKIFAKPDPECPIDPDICPGDCGTGAALPPEGGAWQPGYLRCPADPCSYGHRENAYGNCTPCRMCSAPANMVGIDCLQCEMCIRNPECVV